MSCNSYLTGNRTPHPPSSAVSNDSSSTPIYLLSLLLYNTSLTFFKFSLDHIEVSTAYAVWSALGTAAVSGAGVVLFGER